MSAWQRATNAGERLAITVDGRRIEAQAGDSVATALFAAGLRSFARHPVTGEPLAPWCLIGHCFGCLCTIDGRPGSQACLTPVAEGMRVETGAPESRGDG